MVFYVWYDHGLLRNTGEADTVEKAIKAHDFETFCKIRDKYPDGKDYCFFPTYAWDDDNNEVDITTPEGFATITHSEYECG